MSAPGKLHVLSMLTSDRKRFFIKMQSICLRCFPSGLCHVHLLDGLLGQRCFSVLGSLKLPTLEDPMIKKIIGRGHISVGKWNVRTLRLDEKLEQLAHAMGRYNWNKVGICEMRLKKKIGEMPEDGHKVYFIEEDDRHEYGAGFLGHSECCLRMATSLQHTDQYQ